MLKIKDLDAKWTPDCQGKWDFDFSILKVSTRYYSPQYSYMRYSKSKGFETGIVDEKRHSISGSIYLGDKEIWECELEDKAEVDIKKIYEKIIEEKINKIYGVLIQAGLVEKVEEVK